ncbi:hypothetical protein BD779DRAFT_1548928 [Infundibulicybe gibba]|nr:hypothetical protein BD779DRAFT_1548928 [Infundibulicybe gibba]
MPLHCQLPIKLSKSTILNPEPRNAAVKLALAETHYPSISRSTGRLAIVLFVTACSIYHPALSESNSTSIQDRRLRDQSARTSY